jgi:hypothetical protein
MKVKALVEELRRRSVELGILGFPYLAFVFTAWDRLKRWLRSEGRPLEGVPKEK